MYESEEDLVTESTFARFIGKGLSKMPELSLLAHGNCYYVVVADYRSNFENGVCVQYYVVKSIRNLQ